MRIQFCVVGIVAAPDRMMDWATQDYASTRADSIYVAPDDGGGVLLDEGYDTLGRRRPQIAGLWPREAHLYGAADGTHWGRGRPDEPYAARSAERFTGAPEMFRGGGHGGGHGGHGGGHGGSQNYGGNQNYGGQNYDGHYGGSQNYGWTGAPAGPMRGPPARPWAPQQGWAPGIHMSDRQNLAPIYRTDYDERPAGYNPASWGPFSRLVTQRQLGYNYDGNYGYAGAAPWYTGDAPCASAYLPPDAYTRGWAQNTPWANVPVDAFAGKPGATSDAALGGGALGGGALGGGEMGPAAYLLLVFILFVVISLVLCAACGVKKTSADSLIARPVRTIHEYS